MSKKVIITRNYSSSLTNQIDAKKLLTNEEIDGPDNVKQVMSMKNVSSIASNIMSKYGWKEGQGLLYLYKKLCYYILRL